MSNSDFNRVLELLNSEYICLENSREYRLGKKIYKIIDAVKRCDIGTLCDFVRAIICKNRIRAFSKEMPKTDIVFTEGSRVSEFTKGAVYTCITADYEKLIEPLYGNVDYYCFTDNMSQLCNSSWNQIIIDKRGLEGNQINRYYKMHPFEVLPSHRFSVYVDGNVRVISDVTTLFSVAAESKCGIAMHKHHERNCIYDEARACILEKRGNSRLIHEQMKRYRNEGYPDNNGLFEATIIVVDNANPVSKFILSEWWNEFHKTGSGRDQLSFPYVLWKNGFSSEDIGFLGNNLLYNPKFRIERLGDHRYMRKK